MKGADALAREVGAGSLYVPQVGMSWDAMATHPYLVPGGRAAA